MEGMLPDADDFPSPAPKLAGDVAVAGHVGLAFAVPAGAVGVRAGVRTWGSEANCLCRQAPEYHSPLYLNYRPHLFHLSAAR